MELFDFIKVVFTPSSEYSSVLAGEKRKHFFIAQRRFAIGYPMQANALQHVKINQSAVMDFWHNFLVKNHKYMPNWIYTKGVVKAKEVKEKKLTISSDTVKEYCKLYSIDPKTVKDALELFNSRMVEELKQFEQMIKMK
jgi:hypothetical protein